MATPKKTTVDALQTPAIHTPSKAKFVTVASKLEMSIEIQLTKATPVRTTGQFGSTKEIVHVKHGAVHVIRGVGYPRGQQPEGFPDRPQMIRDANGGYALTPNVPADFWAKWLEQNESTDMVRNGMIKAQPDLDSLAADCKEHASVSSGLGPINPKGDPRSPKPINSAVSAVQAASAAA